MARLHTAAQWWADWFLLHLVVAGVGQFALGAAGYRAAGDGLFAIWMAVTLIAVALLLARRERP